MEQTGHQMEATYQVTGHLLLTCPDCGRSVQIDQETKARKVLKTGDFGTPHSWTMDGLCVGTAGSTTEPDGEDSPLDGSGPAACRLPN